MSVLMPIRKIEIVTSKGTTVTVTGSEQAALFKVGLYHYDEYRADTYYTENIEKKPIQLQLTSVSIDKILAQFVLGDVDIDIQKGFKTEASFTLLDSNNVFKNVVDVREFFQFILGKTVRIYVGYVGRGLTKIFEGYIQGFNTSLPENGRPEITIRALHIAALVNNEAFSFSYPYKNAPGDNSIFNTFVDLLTSGLLPFTSSDGVTQVNLQRRQEAAQSFMDQLKKLNMKQWAIGVQSLTLEDIVRGIASDYIRKNQGGSSAKHYYETVEFLKFNTDMSIVKDVKVLLDTPSITSGSAQTTSTALTSVTTYATATPNSSASVGNSRYPTYTLDNPLIQNTVSDFTFLTRLAEENGCFFWIDPRDGVMYFVSKDYIDSVPDGQAITGTQDVVVNLYYHRVGYPLAPNIHSYPENIGLKFEDRKGKDGQVNIPCLKVDFSIDSTEFVGGLFGSLKKEDGKEQAHSSVNNSQLPSGSEVLIPHNLTIEETSDDKSVNPATPKFPQLKCTIIGEPHFYLGQFVNIYNVVRGDDSQDSQKSVRIRGFIVGIKHRVGEKYTTDLEIVVVPIPDLTQKK